MIKSQSIFFALFRILVFIIETKIYLKVYNELKNRIKCGIWEKYEKIPSERILAAELRVNRMTLRKALQLLVNEKILEKRIGSGTFVINKI